MGHRSTTFPAIAFAVLLLAGLASAQEFSAPVPLNTNAQVDAGQDWDPKIATDGSGNWIAVWTLWGSAGTYGADDDLVYSRSTDNGQTWSAPALLNSNGHSDSGGDTEPDIATDRSGAWVVVWRSFDSLGGTVGTDADILWSRSTDNGASWTSPKAVNSNAAIDSAHDANPRIASDEDGAWIVVWNSAGAFGLDFEIALSRSTNSGTTWSAALNLSNTSDERDDTDPAIVTDNAGTWVAVWDSINQAGDSLGSDYDVRYSRSTNAGVTWSVPASLNSGASSDTADDFSADIETDGAGNWGTVWVQSAGTTGSDWDLRGSRSTNLGQTWSASQLVNTNGSQDSGDEYAPRIVTDRSGNWLVVWWSSDDLEGTAGSDFDVLVTHSTNAGLGWTSPSPLNANANTDSGSDRAPEIATDSLGHWVAVWRSDDTLGGTIGTDSDILTSGACIPVPEGGDCDTGETQFVLQPGPDSGNDIWTTSVYSYASGGSTPGGGRNDETLRVGGWADQYYSLLHFELPSTGRQAKSATLSLFLLEQGNGGVTAMYLDRVASAWDWRNAGTGRDRERLWWADRPSTDFVRSLPAPAAGTWYEIDITELYNQWQGGSVPNYGVQLRPQSTSNNFNHFASSDYSLDPSLRPRLTVVLAAADLQSPAGPSPTRPVYEAAEAADSSPGIQQLVLVTHGLWADALSGSWPQEMSLEIAERISEESGEPKVHSGLDGEGYYLVGDTVVTAYNWSSSAKLSSFASPTNIKDRAEGVGRYLGKWLVDKGYASIANVHLIGHSAGSAVINEAARALRAESDSITIHTTFLDPYVGIWLGGAADYGIASNWSDSYFTSDLTGEPTSQIGRAHNVNVTWAVRPNLEIGYPHHGGPWEFYLDTVVDVVPANDGYGYPLSKEVGGWMPLSHLANYGNPVVLGTPPQPTEQPLYQSTVPYTQLDFDALSNEPGAISISETGQVSFGGTSFSLTSFGGSEIQLNASEDPATSSPSASDEPAWLAVRSTAPGPRNVITFEAAFDAPGEGEGYLVVLWDGTIVGEIDERDARVGWQNYTFPLPATFDGAPATLAFRIDGHSSQSATVTIRSVVGGLVQEGTCGDGLVVSPYECDDGGTSFAPGDYCRADCTLVPCGKPTDSVGSIPKTTDALFALRAAVGQVVCSPHVCDVDSNGDVQVSDALRILRSAVGQAVALECS
jgi:hypothetical protein